MTGALSLHISVDLRDPTPIYEQVMSSIKELINRAELRSGDRLPTVRQLAQDLGVNLNTVARAYRELAGQGVLSVRQGRGVHVISTTIPCDSAKRDELRRRMKALVNEAAFAGLGLHQLNAMMSSEFSALKETQR